MESENLRIRGWPCLDEIFNIGLIDTLASVVAKVSTSDNHLEQQQFLQQSFSQEILTKNRLP
jgi:hypothetical protein